MATYTNGFRKEIADFISVSERYEVLWHGANLSQEMKLELYGSVRLNCLKRCPNRSKSSSLLKMLQTQYGT